MTIQASKRLMSLLLAVAFAGAAIATASAQPASAPVVATTSGKVAGLRAGELAVFKGLPYAAPPVGGLRWREPKPVAAWKSVRKADAFGPACMQAPGAAELAGAGAPGPLSEDCLTLNIWTPGPQASANRPVMVWIHGGALVFGSGRQRAAWWW
jgi:para-nitrobenzyl esterase